MHSLFLTQNHSYSVRTRTQEHLSKERVVAMLEDSIASLENVNVDDIVDKAASRTSMKDHEHGDELANHIGSVFLEVHGHVGRENHRDHKGGERH